MNTTRRAANRASPCSSRRSRNLGCRIKLESQYVRLWSSQGTWSYSKVPLSTSLPKSFIHWSGLAVSISTVKSLVRSRPDCGWLPKGDAVGGVSAIVLVGAGSVRGTELAPR